MALWHLFLSDLLDAVFPAADSVPSDRNHQEELPALHPEAEMPKGRVQGVSIKFGEPCRLNYAVSWDILCVKLPISPSTISPPGESRLYG